MFMAFLRKSRFCLRLDPFVLSTGLEKDVSAIERQKPPAPKDVSAIFWM